MTDRIRIGNKSDFSGFPATVRLLGETYFLVKEEDGYQLLSSVCPHMGGTIVPTEEGFECPVHLWKFEGTSGICLTNRNQAMKKVDVSADGDQLYAVLAKPDKNGAHQSPDRSSGKIDTEVKVTLHAHACLELAASGFSLLTDPWLEGPCFLGAWTHYPPPRIRASELSPQAIWISHEHSDHFHEPTLRQFDRATPVYFPDFPNQRLNKRLAELGFRHVHPMPFGEKVTIAPDFHITCYQPTSLWNDAMVLIEIGEFRFLNLNDAGLNPFIANLVGPVDVVASGFSPGASGYPLTWHHLSREEKQDIMRKSSSGLLMMLEKAAELYNAKYMLPFASHFELWHPDHQRFVEMAVKNHLDHVVSFFEGKRTGVLDLLPGESWTSASHQFTRAGYDRAALYTKEARLRAMQTAFDPHAFAGAYPGGKSVSENQVIVYLDRLNEVPEIMFSEEVAVKLRSIGKKEGSTFEVNFRVQGGRLVFGAADDMNGVVIEMPNEILAAVITEDLSWDEAFIGYWCRFSRHPDVYHGDFWRLLQAPYYRKKPQITRAALRDGIVRHTVIADLVERNGAEAERILGRYGLYCTGCHRSTEETLEIAARAHGITEEKLERLTAEMEAIFYTD